MVRIWSGRALFSVFFPFMNNSDADLSLPYVALAGGSCGFVQSEWIMHKDAETWEQVETEPLWERGRDGTAVSASCVHVVAAL